MGGSAQIRQGGPGGTDEPEHVDVQDAVPLLVRVVLDAAGRTDAGVVDQDVDPAECRGRGVDRRAYGGVVGDVGGEAP